MYVNAVAAAIKYLVIWFGIYLIYFFAFALMKSWNQNYRIGKGLSLLFCVFYSSGISIFCNIRANGIRWDSALTVFIISLFASLVARYNVYHRAKNTRNFEKLERIITEDYTEED
jgi:hypothetical protein